MKPSKRFTVAMLAAVAGFSAMISSGWTHAQNYPTRPILLVVPFPAGGPTDVQARVFAQKLSERLGQPIVVENRGGAGGMLGSAIVAKAAPDGYTLLIGSSGPLTIGPHLLIKPLYDSIKDFVPISMISSSQLMLVVNPSVKANNVRELIALAKSQPGKLNYGSPGAGSTAHLTGQLFNTMAGIKIEHIAYKGSAPAMVDLLGGQIQLVYENVISALPNVKAGKLRALAVTGKRRSETMLDLPTVVEAGFPDFEAIAWMGFLGPKGLPPEITTLLNKESVAILRDPQVREYLVSNGSEPAETTPAEFAELIKAEIEKWGAVVKTTGLTPN